MGQPDRRERRVHRHRPRTRFLCEFAPVELRTAPGGRLVIGERTGINYGTSFHAVESITVGRNVDFGPHCIISDADTGSVDHPDRAAVAPVVIGDGAWLASRVTVLPGSTIGAGAVITAGSVVDGDIPPGVVAGGIPARVLRVLDGASDQPRSASRSPRRLPASPPPRRPPPDAAPAPVAPISGRGLLISDFTIDPLARALERPTAAVRVHAELAPYDTVAQTLLAPPRGGHRLRRRVVAPGSDPALLRPPPRRRRRRARTTSSATSTASPTSSSAARAASAASSSRRGRWRRGWPAAGSPRAARAVSPGRSAWPTSG